MRCILLIVSVWLLVPDPAGRAVEGQTRRPTERTGTGVRPLPRQWLTHDLHLAAREVLSQETESGQHVLVFRQGFSMILGGRQFTSDSAVVWIRLSALGPQEPSGPGYEIQAYLRGRVSSKQTAGLQSLDMKEVVTKRGEAVVIAASIGGEVFVTADDRQRVSLGGLPICQEAIAAFDQAGLELPPVRVVQGPPIATAPEPDRRARDESAAGYTVSIAPRDEATLAVEFGLPKDGVQIVTMIGRAYALWQEPADDGGPDRLIELQADSLVLWRRVADEAPQASDASPMQQEGVIGIYVAGDVQFREGQHTIRADEFYYDLQIGGGLARNAVMRSFDPSRNVPIYVRARELRQVSKRQFEANDVTLTTSEFRTPQVSVSASKIRILDRTGDAERDGRVAEGSYTAEMKDVRFKYYDTTIFALPSVRSDLEGLDVPIRSIRMGHDSTYGTSVETRWFLSRILGLREPEGTDSTLSLDYYGDRGAGGGVEVDYERENYFGRLLGYAIEDHGQDRLGRTRKNVDVPDETRGLFKFQHRHFLPYSWQLTAETSYLSDRNFLEQYYRREFFVDKEQETVLHLKRIDGNRGFAALGKARINDFADKVEEQPSAEYHWTGQSLFGDRFTFFSDTQVSRYRYRYAQGTAPDGPEDFFGFAQTRNELDMPMAVGKSKVVPFVAGTFAFDDGTGFRAELDDTPGEVENSVWIGEAGVRMSAQPFWRVYPGVRSRLWDLDRLRHVIRPSLTAVTYVQSDAVAEQRDTLDLGISQRLQTRRGPAGRRRTVDWLDLDLDFVWVNDSGDPGAGPDQFIWNDPFIPLVNRRGDVLAPQDRRTTGMFGPRRNYTSAAMTLRLSDTTAVLGDVYVDMQSGAVKQVNMGFSRLCWPDLSYYIGSRYLRDVENGLGQKGSNALTFAATYVLDPRYTAVFAQQYDFDYGLNIRSDLTLIRKYHRLNLAVTVSADESLDEERVVLSLWPEGVPELAFGLRRYVGLGASETY